jgi:hypothetical protein
MRRSDAHGPGLAAVTNRSLEGHAQQIRGHGPARWHSWFVDQEWHARGSLELGFDGRPLLPLFAKLSGTISRGWGARGAEALNEALSRVDATVLERRVEESEGLSVLVGRALQTAADSTLRNKRRLLGQLISEATLDDAAIDDNLVWIDILARVDGPHVRCMGGCPTSGADGGRERGTRDRGRRG